MHIYNVHLYFPGGGRLENFLKLKFQIFDKPKVDTNSLEDYKFWDIPFLCK